MPLDNSTLSNALPSQYQQFIHLSRYSRWQDEKGRRETWSETVSRLVGFFEEHLAENYNYVLEEGTKNNLEQEILSLGVMPSMRAMMTAGPALKRDNIAGYNCSFKAVNKVTAFDEILYILMNGTGVGFSVERQHVNELPRIADEFHPTDTVIQVAD